MTQLQQTFRKLALIACSCSLLWTAPSCSSESPKQEEAAGEILPTDTTALITVDTVQAVEEEIDWPDTLHHSGEFEESSQAATNKADSTVATKASNTATPSTETKATSLSGSKVNSKSSKTSSSSSTSSTVSEKQLEKKFNQMMELKVAIGKKLDCMRISPMSRTHLAQTKKLHDKFLGILPSMLIWVRFEDNKLSKIMKTDPESLKKLNTLSDGWQNSYLSVNKQADAIWESYKSKDFYGNCE